jgi:hypothetical protein
MTIPARTKSGQRGSARAFGSPVVQNDFHGLVAEINIESALRAARRCCSGDWLGWDFEHHSHLELRGQAGKALGIGLMTAGTALVFLGLYAGGWSG